MDPRLRLEVAGQVATLLLARPDKKNAMDQAMWEALPPLVAEACARPGVRVLLLASSTPGIFCAGADIAEFAGRATDRAWWAANRRAIRAAQQALVGAPLPTVAVIDGDCVGGGCGLALACDLRLASPRSRFGITPARLGLVYPLHDTRLLVDLVGPAQAKRMLYTARLLPAAEAAAIGLVTELAEDVEAAARALAADICAVSGDSQRWAKATVARILAGVRDDDAESEALFDSARDGPDFAEGVAAFLGKRPARFR
ncbi:enoyl-CoA hydratase/isomerase family protein [Thermaurantiacus tibetensis]|uniref:enoyl-CoA hydratase/isomerase family protein n=1 Tax=Thermaurantiacus tibetensis TaxID=2759035 RepID=UPI00188E46B6|nr:enoyl-CoA hydratase-related protein [Thermaurantiacus tibetensis]